MKVFITGATGGIGGGAFQQCLDHPAITKVVAFSRRGFPEPVASHEKLEVVLTKDFSTWDEEMFRKHSDAKAMIWAMGSQNGSETIDFEYPLAFQRAFIKFRKDSGDTSQFTYVHLSGKWVEPDQDKPLYFLEAHRKLKGRHETQATALAQANTPWWRLFIVRPGGVITRSWYFPGLVEALLGKNITIRAEEVGAFMAYLATGGEEEGVVMYNQRMVEKGRELLQAKGK